MRDNRLIESRLRGTAHEKMIAVIESSRFDLQTVKANSEIHRTPTSFNVKRMTWNEASARLGVVFPHATSERSQERALLVSVSDLSLAENNEAVKHLIII